MEFKNLTPFSVINYKMLDTEDREYHVVAMKVSYQLKPVTKGIYHAEVVDQSPPELCIQDQFSGELNASSVIEESDLAPFKPKCDVIINGTAYAPDGQPCTSFPVAVKLSDAKGNVLLEKQLNVTGERYFEKHLTGWHLSQPTPFSELKLDYQFAFGGECCVYTDDPRADKIENSHRLTDEQRAQHPNQENTPIAHTVCEFNPLGIGFIEPWYHQVKSSERYPAPRIELRANPITADFFSRLVKGEIDQNNPCLQPAGLGIIGRPWLPRRQKAGTYDHAWLTERHPYLPADFDFAYWNAAPEDQQIAYPPNDLAIELTHLSHDKTLKTQLPNYIPYILLRMKNGEIYPQYMMLDTLLIDTDNLLVSLTYRYVMTVDADIRVMESRFITNIDASLFRTLHKTK